MSPAPTYDHFPNPPSTHNFDAPPEAYVLEDEFLLRPHLRSAVRGYSRDDVHKLSDAMRRRIVELRAQLEKQRQVQMHAYEFVTAAENRAEEILTDAVIQANATVAEANATAEKLLADTKRTCDRAAQHGIRSAFEMANLLGYEPGKPHELMGAIGQVQRPENVDNFESGPEEQHAFDQFFAVEDEDSKARRWMATS